MTVYVLPQSLSPGHELRRYFHTSQVDVKGSRNLSGINNPAVDELVEKVIEAKDRKALVDASHALDRVLLWNYYSIPNWYLDYHRIAHWNKFAEPGTQPKLMLGFQNWWIKDQ